MADLIDRDALMADIATSVVFSGRTSRNAEMRGANKIIDRIKAAPTVDATEVIHCHECIGKNTWLNDPKYGCAICGMSGMYPKNENGYCSYAIRKDNKK